MHVCRVCEHTGPWTQILGNPQKAYMGKGQRQHSCYKFKTQHICEWLYSFNSFLFSIGMLEYILGSKEMVEQMSKISKIKCIHIVSFGWEILGKFSLRLFVTFITLISQWLPICIIYLIYRMKYRYLLGLQVHRTIFCIIVSQVWWGLDFIDLIFKLA